METFNKIFDFFNRIYPVSHFDNMITKPDIATISIIYSNLDVISASRNADYEAKIAKQKKEFNNQLMLSFSRESIRCHLMDLQVDNVKISRNSIQVGEESYALVTLANFDTLLPTITRYFSYESSLKSSLNELHQSLVHSEEVTEEFISEFLEAKNKAREIATLTFQTGKRQTRGPEISFFDAMENLSSITEDIENLKFELEEKIKENLESIMSHIASLPTIQLIKEVEESNESPLLKSL